LPWEYWQDDRQTAPAADGGVEGGGPPAEGGDGVVQYSSAHIEGVESEKIVNSPHSMQGNPETIQELKRILIEHADRFFDSRRESARKDI
jgi:hypothetical protein